MKGIYMNKKDINNLSNLVKIGRRKKVHFTSNSWYFIWNGKRIKGEDILRLTYPIYLEDTDGKLSVITGYIQVSNRMVILIEVNDDMETIQMYRQID